MNIYLIGYRCTGKTSIGSALARQLAWTFVDTDARITAELGTTIADTVRRDGWEAFRMVETRVVAELASKSRCIVATGGGVIVVNDNVRRMKRSGIVIWLQASPETIRARMSDDVQTDENRPSLTGKTIGEEIVQVLAERRPLYQAAADFAIDTETLDIDSAVVQIRLLLPQYGVAI